MPSRYLFALSFARTFVNNPLAWVTTTEEPVGMTPPTPSESSRRRSSSLSLSPSLMYADSRVSFLDWAIILIWHEVLLFPFPGCLILYSLHEDVSISILFLGTLFGLWSITTGVPLLANARQFAYRSQDHEDEDASHRNRWLTYTAVVTLISSAGLFFVTGLDVTIFLPFIAYPIFMSIPCCTYGYRKLVARDNDSLLSPTEELERHVHSNYNNHREINDSRNHHLGPRHAHLVAGPRSAAPPQPLSSEIHLYTPTSPSASIVVVTLFPAASVSASQSAADDIHDVMIDDEEDPPTYENFEPPSYEESVINHGNRQKDNQSDVLYKVPK